MLFSILDFATKSGAATRVNADSVPEMIGTPTEHKLRVTAPLLEEIGVDYSGVLSENEDENYFVNTFTVPASMLGDNLPEGTSVNDKGEVIFMAVLTGEQKAALSKAGKKIAVSKLTSPQKTMGGNLEFSSSGIYDMIDAKKGHSTHLDFAGAFTIADGAIVPVEEGQEVAETYYLLSRNRQDVVQKRNYSKKDNGGDSKAKAKDTPVADLNPNDDDLLG